MWKRSHWVNTYASYCKFEFVGTVWMQQILAKIMEASYPDWAEDVTNRVQIPWFEGRTVDDPHRERKDPRVFRTHLPPEMLPRGVKDKQIKVIILIIQPLIEASIHSPEKKPTPLNDFL